MMDILVPKYDSIISISIFLLLLPCSVFALGGVSYLPLPANTLGPETVAFNSTGGLFTGVAYGKILEYQGPEKGFVIFAYSSINSSKPICNNPLDMNLGPICGRPLGLKFNNATNELYVTDAYYGLLVVNGSEGGVATQLATSADGVPFRLLDAVDIDQETGIVYFVDASANFPLSLLVAAVLANDSSGRLLKYDPVTKQVTVLMSNLSGPGGVAISNDSSYLLFTEFIGKRIQKYWLKGPKANTSEIIKTFLGFPDNVQITSRGDFWVAVNTLPVPTGVRIDGEGNVLQTMSLSGQLLGLLISEVHEKGNAIYTGSMTVKSVAVYDI